jgi:TPR repeat protein
MGQLHLGFLYTLGDGVPKNYAEAMKWTLMAAKQGNSTAQEQMSGFYKLGEGVPQNYILAYMWESVAGQDPVYEELAKRHLSKELEPHMAPSQIAEAQEDASQRLQGAEGRNRP